MIEQIKYFYNTTKIIKSCLSYQRPFDLLVIWYHTSFPTWENIVQILGKFKALCHEGLSFFLLSQPVGSNDPQSGKNQVLFELQNPAVFVTLRAGRITSSFNFMSTCLSLKMINSNHI